MLYKKKIIYTHIIYNGCILNLIFVFKNFIYIVEMQIENYIINLFKKFPIAKYIGKLKNLHFSFLFKDKLLQIFICNFYKFVTFINNRLCTHVII